MRHDKQRRYKTRRVRINKGDGKRRREILQGKRWTSKRNRCDMLRTMF